MKLIELGKTRTTPDGTETYMYCNHDERKWCYCTPKCYYAHKHHYKYKPKPSKHNPITKQLKLF